MLTGRRKAFRVDPRNPDLFDWLCMQCTHDLRLHELISWPVRIGLPCICSHAGLLAVVIEISWTSLVRHFLAALWSYTCLKTYVSLCRNVFYSPTCQWDSQRSGTKLDATIIGQSVFLSGIIWTSFIYSQIIKRLFFFLYKPYLLSASTLHALLHLLLLS
jgi:hypothetical protein